MQHADRPARVPEARSGTSYTTTRVMAFTEGAGDQPWCLHLSYCKPHWRYIVPPPYCDMHWPEHVLPAVRSEAERFDPHPVRTADHQHRFSKVFARDEVCARCAAP
ncbi:hypothetical protein So717_21470 [Roseobacter cerasinus]|uniref:Uncharacterized protein n=2 Tax=Roseobacter cerasinus TaxID=2602289 RepID=A0A640VS03_9RHOB|nr:hypothetical protein So717_21470 [Roseobacter cerasinus]